MPTLQTSNVSLRGVGRERGWGGRGGGGREVGSGLMPCRHVLIEPPHSWQILDQFYPNLGSDCQPLEHQLHLNNA